LIPNTHGREKLAGALHRDLGRLDLNGAAIIGHMSNADSKTLNSVIACLDRQHLQHESSEEQHCTKLIVRNGGAIKIPVSVYNSGKIVVGGKQSPLKSFLEEMAKAIENSGTLPGQLLPLEIDGLPEKLKERVPDCDPVIVRFVEEAVRCYGAEALAAVGFMIGAASERAIGLLIHAYADSIRDETNRAKFISTISKSVISKKYDEFAKSFNGCQNRPPVDSPLSHDLETVIEGMFQFCRITRNEVGHPQIVPDLDKGVLLANLAHVVTYMERIYKLIDYFRTNGVLV
jgi:hypothetical protein